MLVGSGMSMSLLIVTLVFSLPFGLVLTLLNTGRNRAARAVTGVYIMILRGTPLLLQMFFIYFGIPIFFISVGMNPRDFTLGAFESCAIAFVLNYAAYFAEIFRGGLLAVDKGQYEAAKVLGMNKYQTFTRIIMPQMIRISLPAVANEAIILVKDTALMTALSVQELLFYTKSVVNKTTNIAYFAVAALFYLVMSWALSVLFKRLEKKYRMD